MGKSSLESGGDSKSVILTNIFTPLIMFQAKTVLNTLNTWTQFFLTTALWGMCFIVSIYIDEDTEIC